MRAAVVGHVEWIDFIRVARVPTAGQIVHAIESWSEPGGGGAVAAVQLCKLAGLATLFTALGNDALAARAYRKLRQPGLQVEASRRPEPQRRAITYIDGSGERTITVLGHRASPYATDPLPWPQLRGADAVYLTAGDVEAVRRARKARVLVATSRILPLLRAAGVRLDALVGSANDPAEHYAGDELDPAPDLVVRTAGAKGGTFQVGNGHPCPYRAAPAPGPVVDTYGCGDSFAAGLTHALGLGLDPEEAVQLAARCGAAVASGRGPYTTQLHARDL